MSPISWLSNRLQPHDQQKDHNNQNEANEHVAGSVQFAPFFFAPNHGAHPTLKSAPRLKALGVSKASSHRLAVLAWNDSCRFLSGPEPVAEQISVEVEAARSHRFTHLVWNGLY